MKLRWGILGTGLINRALIPAIRESDRGELVAVASRTAERAQSYAAQWGIPRAHGSYQALVDDPGIDAIYNSLPNHLHAEWTIRALDAGKHVLCEKPFALTVADVDAMFEAARRKDRKIADAFMYRHHPRIHRLRDLALDGTIGDARLIRSSFRFIFDRPENTRWDPAMGGGALWDIGCYPVSLARYIFGEPPSSVQSWERCASSGVDLTFVATMFHSRDRVAQFDCSFEMAYRTQAEIVGTKASLLLDLPFRPDEPGSRILLVRDGEEEEIPIEHNPWRYKLEVEELHAQILDGKGPEIPPQETRDNIETIVKLKAHSQKRWKSD